MAMNTEKNIVVGDVQGQVSVMSTGKPPGDILKSTWLFSQIVFHHFAMVLASEF